jgi:hypothetical protein
MYFSDLGGFVPISQHVFPRRGTMVLRQAVGCDGVSDLKES